MSTADGQGRLPRASDLDARPGSLPPRHRITLWSLAIGLFWVSFATLIGFYELTLPLAFVLASVQCGTLPLAARFPRSAVLLHVATIVVVGTLTRDDLFAEFWPVPLASTVALCGLLAVLGARDGWFVSGLAWGLAVLAMGAVVVLDPDAPATFGEWGDDLLITVSVTLVALVLSTSLTQRRRVRRIIAAAEREVELAEARRAVVEERARIARELHDVVAHSMSIVHIRAESARFRIGDLESAHEEFTDIARSARAALGEMRRLLQALHPDAGEAFYAPQPTVLEIPDLVEGAEKVGSPVTFTSDVSPGSLGPIVELTAYRIVQEALSNVVRHAPRARVEVSLRRGPGAVTVQIRNAPSPSATRADGMELDSGGHGLRGMRERVALLDGEVVQTLLPDGGFLITARLPVTERRIA